MRLKRLFLTLRCSTPESFRNIIYLPISFAVLLQQMKSRKQYQWANTTLQEEQHRVGFKLTIVLRKRSKKKMDSCYFRR